MCRFKTLTIASFNFINLPQLEVKVMEPRRNSSTASRVKRIQTLILAEDGDDGDFFNHAESNDKDKLGNGHEGVKQPQSWNYHQHARCDS